MAATKKKKSVLIGMPCYSGMVPAISVQSLLQLHKPCPTGFMMIDRQRIDKARNVIAAEALQNDFDYLLFIDDDNPVPPETLEMMIEDDKDIVVAPILARNPNEKGEYPLCAFYKNEIEGVYLYENIKEFKGKGPLHQIDAGGTGCMLIKRKVLEKLFKKYEGEIFKFGEVVFKKAIKIGEREYTKRTMSEDCEFCERAVGEGFEIWLDDRIRPYHITTYNLIQYKT